MISDSQISRELVTKSIETIRHRGPDEVGYYFGENCHLGMCRLAIIDVKSGQQPSYSSCGQIISVFNGEIYNYQELRKLLLARGHKVENFGDSALIPFLYVEYGDTFPTLIEGMFAIAIYDKIRNRLILARDRVGEKPLWYSVQNRNLYFSSELKGLAKLGLRLNFNTDLIPEFLSYGFINAPQSPYFGVRNLFPGTIMFFEEGRETSREYWNPSEIYEREIDFYEAKEELESLLRAAVKSRLISERPVGTFLSSGIDSALITSFAQEESQTPLKSFTISFEDDKFDEAKQARLIAEGIGTIHFEGTAVPDAALIINEVAGMLDQPFADSSIIPTFILSKLAREHVVVALSGDGGDEVFGGYPRYLAATVLDILNPLLRLNLLQHLPSGRLANPRIRKIIENSGHMRHEQRYERLQSLLKPSDLLRYLDSESISRTKPNILNQLWESSVTSNRFRMMQEVDLRWYLPGDLMYKVDIASMANSLEVRSPFLDFRVIEFGLSLPTRFKMGRFEPKHILKQLARERISSDLMSRQKKGFGIPRGQWLRKDLRQLVEEVLLDHKCKSRGWYENSEIERLLKRHQGGEELDHVIWPLLMLELWATNWIDGSNSSTD